jgi:translation initiation factor 4G
LTLELEDKDRRVKRKYLGTIRFIGELFMLGMLTVKIMHECVHRLLGSWNKHHDEDSVECMCKLLTTIGKKMDEPEVLKNASVAADHRVRKVPQANLRQPKFR